MGFSFRPTTAPHTTSSGLALDDLLDGDGQALDLASKGSTFSSFDFEEELPIPPGKAAPGTR